MDYYPDLFVNGKEVPRSFSSRLTSDFLKELGQSTTIGDDTPTEELEADTQRFTRTVRKMQSSPLTEEQISKYIEAKCWINGIYLNSMDTEYLINCKNYATQRLYNKWYWKFFLNLVNEEIVNRDVAIGPKKYYPGTENIPRRGGNQNYSSYGSRF